jgi:hypothetical protein
VAVAFEPLSIDAMTTSAGLRAGVFAFSACTARKRDRIITERYYYIIL